MAAVFDNSHPADPPTRAPESDEWPDHIGLLSGIFAVICGQVVVILYHYWHLHYSPYSRIQSEPAKASSFWQDALVHVSQPEGFVLLGSYLCGTWMFNLMPKSYYSWDGGVNVLHVFMQVVHCNVWSYMAFGTLYSSWLTLIHSEITHPWDPLCRQLGVGTAADHHVHHKCFMFNYGHLFMWWDKLFGTYRSPMDITSFNKDI